MTLRSGFLNQATHFSIYLDKPALVAKICFANSFKQAKKNQTQAFGFFNWA
jgi:hypothetical protein